MTAVVEVLFWGAAALLAYTYLGYPLLMCLLGAARPRRWRQSPDLPSVTVLVVAHDEAARIDGRLQNLLSLDYPRDRLEIIVGSDGSTDGTAARVRRWRPLGVRAPAFPRRRGKPAVLNELVPLSRGEIIVLADVRQRFERGALRALVAPFGDPRVGAVSGELMLSVAGRLGSEGVGLYWRYEKVIRKSESLVASTIGATGAIYAIRRKLYEPIPEDTVLDDVLIPVRIARRGYRLLFTPEARAWDQALPPRQEFARKARTLAGNFQLFARERWLLDPRRNPLWLQTISHRGLRLLAPILLVLLFDANLLLGARDFYHWTLGAQLLFYASATGGWLGQRAGHPLRWLAVPYTFCVLNWAACVGLWRFLTGRQTVTWEREIPAAEIDLVQKSA